MKKRLILTILLVSVSLLFYAVVTAQSEKQEKQQEMKSEKMMKAPDTTGQAVLNFIQKAEYEKNWKMWPGKDKFYEGTEPHGALLTTYVNDIAYGAITGNKKTLPDKSMIIKENYKPNKEMAAITVMYKVKGYNPQAGDWFWAKYAPGGKIAASGKVQSCMGCHGSKKANDYIMTASLGKKMMEDEEMREMEEPEEME